MKQKVNANIATLLSLLMVLIYHQSHAQINFGLYAGSVTNKFEGDDVRPFTDLRFSVQSSIAAGIVADFFIKPDVAITVVPGYKKISGTILEVNPVYLEQIEDGLDPTVPVYLEVSDIRLHYLSLPVMFKVISDNEKWQFMAGAEVGWNITSKMRLFKTGEERNISDHVKNFYLSAVFGFGYKLKIKKQKFSIDLMYSQGLINVSEGKQLSSSNVPRIKSTTGETRFTWYFPSNKKQKP